MEERQRKEQKKRLRLSIRNRWMIGSKDMRGSSKIIMCTCIISHLSSKILERQEKQKLFELRIKNNKIDQYEYL